MVAPDDDPQRVLRAARAATEARVARLTAEFDEIVTTAAMAGTTDDEHDPEGHTIAYERQQIAGLLHDARAQLGELDQALARVEAGTYGLCEGCGGTIPGERLLARPDARRCVSCAAETSARRR